MDIKIWGHQKKLLIYNIVQKGRKMGLVPQSGLFYMSLCPSLFWPLAST